MTLTFDLDLDFKVRGQEIFCSWPHVSSICRFRKVLDIRKNRRHSGAIIHYRSLRILSQCLTGESTKSVVNINKGLESLRFKVSEE